MNGKTVLVTGASGQLGRRLVRQLIRHGYIVRAHYRSAERAEKYCPPEAFPVSGDLAFPDWVDRAVNGCEYVIHAAAVVSLRPISDATYMRAVNVGGTRAVIEACKKASVRRLVLISTVGAIGGSTGKNPIDETAEFNLAGYGIPYFETKREAEVIALAANSPTLEVVAVNPSIMISAPERPRTPKDLVRIPRWIPVDFDCGLNLGETEDVIQGILAALEWGRPGERYILAGDNVDPEKVFTLAKQYFGMRKPLVKLPRCAVHAAGAISELIYWRKTKKPRLNRNIARLLKFRFYYSSEKARRELGYRPASLDETLRRITEHLPPPESGRGDTRLQSP